MNIDDSKQLALQQYQAGNLKQAENICKDILNIHPDNIEILNLLSDICYQRNNYDLAIQYVRRALEVDQNNSDIHNTLGVLLQELGQLDEAINYFQKSLQFNPNFADPYYNLGIIYESKRQFDQAVKYYYEALKIEPHFVDAYVNIGNIHQAQKQFDEAIFCYQKALQLDPHHAYAYNNLGHAFKEKGNFNESITYYQKALQIDPTLAIAHFNIGDALMELNRLDDSIKSFKRAILLNPDLIDAYIKLGNILDYQGKKEEALEIYDRILELDDNLFIARYAQCMSQLRTIYPDQSAIESSRKRYYEALKKLDNFVASASRKDIENAAEAVGGYQPFLLAYQGFNDKNLQQLYGNMVYKIMSMRYPEFAHPLFSSSCLSNDKINIGIVSGFFHHHSNWKIPIKGWVENIDRNRFRLYSYYTGKTRDKETEIARKCFDYFLEDTYPFEELCKIISGHHINVLIFPELGMDRTALRLAALKLSPVQCVSWGHPETSGLPTIDFFISSDLMEPPYADDHYSENLVRLPNLGIYYTPMDIPNIFTKKEAFGLKQETVVYLCCQSLYKYLPQYDIIYPLIAQQIKDCQFVFISSHLGDWITNQFKIRLNKAFHQFDMDSKDYITFLPRLDEEQYHAINRLSDIYLDSIGWSGCNSTFEAIDYNLPIVTLPGEFMRGRHSSAILTMMGLTETIANSLEDYVALSVRLGTDSIWRKQISDKVAQNKSLIYKDITCVSALENFFEKVVKERG